MYSEIPVFQSFQSSAKYHSSSMRPILGLFLLLFASLSGGAPITIVVITENTADGVPQQMSDAIAMAEKGLTNKATVAMELVQLARENEDESYRNLCGKLKSGVSFVADLTWSGWYRAKQALESAGVPYVRADITIRPFVQALDDFLAVRNGTDAALIFHSEDELDQALYYMIGNSIIRIIVLDKLNPKNLKGLFDMRPTPSFHAIFGTTEMVMDSFKKAVDADLVQRSDRWHLVCMDWTDETVTLAGVNTSKTIYAFQMPNDYCCRLLRQPDSCKCPPNVDIPKLFLENFGMLLGSVINDMVDHLQPRSHDCELVSAATADNTTHDMFDDNLARKIVGHNVLGHRSKEDTVYPKIGMEIKSMSNESASDEIIGTWNTEAKFLLKPGVVLKENRRFFRIGVIDEDEPWSYLKFNETTQKDEWTGYCIDLAKKLAEQMQFDFEFSKPIKGRYGRKQPNGKWDGLVGDLARGETDIVVAALMMTSEREEVIDFVAPYFDQSGISIMIRKAERPTSLFKFMTVLRAEVWVSIVGALTITGIMIWLLDKYSPYSARNNKEMYPYPCREFTLKESFWFALTSFTPQGGGEAPKALSGRTLVAAYWLFVVLMLATFTANLAAFLTVERMKSPVESLEQLARQSKINYTVVDKGDAHQFFKNMKQAEDTLYRVWKELTLNASSDQTQYRVWDYPIKEQYGHILLAIEQTGPVPDEATGIRKVLESKDAQFAFIHDAAAVKYQVYKDCNLTEVGEVFAERPYAVAVQQGSQLQEEISRKILDLQKDRYFETQGAKYWNPQAAGQCPNTDDSEGITLGSLGGVFIATLFGLALAMVTLAGEIFYHKHKHRIDKKLKELKPGSKDPQVDSMNKKFKENMKDVQGRFTVGEQNYRNFRHSDFGKIAPKVSYISVFPRQPQPYD